MGVVLQSRHLVLSPIVHNSSVDGSRLAGTLFGRQKTRVVGWVTRPTEEGRFYEGFRNTLHFKAAR